MRILQICSNFAAGGIQRHALDLGEWLRLRGHHVSFAGTPGKWMNEATDKDFFALDLFRVTEGGGRNVIMRFVHAIFSAVSLRRELKRRQVELVHAHDTAPALVARLATLGLGIPIILTYHGSEPERVGEFGRVGRMTAARIITPSYRTADELRQYANVPNNKLSVIGLGIKPAAEIESKIIQQRRAELLGDNGAILVVTIARLAPQKAIDVLINVVGRVMAQRQDIRFVVVGDGPLEDDVRKWAVEAEVDSCLKFVGRSDKPYEYLKAGDLFMLTSNWEALPITIVEAFRAGLPVIATDTGGVKELVDPSVGRVAQIADAEALAASVLEISADENLRHELSANALKRSKEDRFSPAHIHQIFERTYASVLAETRPSQLSEPGNEV